MTSVSSDASRRGARPVPSRRQGGARHRRIARPGQRRWRLALASAGADVVLHASEQPADRPQRDDRGRHRTAHAHADGQSVESRGRGSTVRRTRSTRSGCSTSWSTTPGSSAASPPPSTATTIWDEVLEVNLTSVFRLSRAAGQPHAAPRRGRKDHQHRLDALVPGRHHRAGLRRREGRARAAHQGARQRVGAARHQRQRDRARLHGDRQHRRRCAPIRLAISRSPNAFRPGSGEHLRTWPAPRSSSRRAHPTTCTVTSSSWTAAG